MHNEQVYPPNTTRDRLQDLMKSRGVTQSDLAAAIGCSIPQKISDFAEAPDGNPFPPSAVAKGITH